MPTVPREAPSSRLRSRIVGIYALLAVLNLGSWIAALICFGDRAELLGIALLVYGLGLRHAIDADHIAAIDNVTRKLMRDDQKPVAVGFFFALGHSAVVILATVAVVLVAGMTDRFVAVREIGGLIGTGVSALFLFAIAAMNLRIFLSIRAAFRHAEYAAPGREQNLGGLLAARGLLARLFRPLLNLVTCSRHMILLGFLFGLGFDTATEVAMFGVSAAQAAKGLSLPAILVFPALFAAGMALADTTDGVMMLGAYQWAGVEPRRRVRYDMAITLISAFVAVGIGSLEVLNLLRGRFLFGGWFWDRVAALNDNFQLMGAAIVLLFAAVWASSAAVAKLRGPHKDGLRPAA